MLVQGCVGEEGNHGNETIIYFVLLRLGICYSINPWFAVRWEISVGFCILEEPLKNGSCQQLLFWRLLQESCYWLSSILHVHNAHTMFVKQCFNFIFIGWNLSFPLVRLMKLSSLDFENICYKYETPWWLFLWNRGRGRKKYIFI